MGPLCVQPTCLNYLDSLFHLYRAAKMQRWREGCLMHGAIFALFSTLLRQDPTGGAEGVVG